MDPHLNEQLTDVVRRWAKPTTPEDLKRRGVKRVRSISLSRVASLIEKAVNRTMMARTLGDFPMDAEGFSVAARSEFMRLVSDNPSTREDPLESQAASALARLKREVAERRREVEQQRRTLETVGGAVGAGDEELERKLRDLFAHWGGSRADPSPLEREVIRLAVAELRNERGRNERARLEDAQKEIELLERRISKLNRLLEQTEAELQKAIRERKIDPGLASIYETVQGLDEMDEHYARKSELMHAIFAANLQMRATLDSVRSGNSVRSGPPAAGPALD